MLPLIGHLLDFRKKSFIIIPRKENVSLNSLSSKLGHGFLTNGKGQSWMSIFLVDFFKKEESC